VTTLDMIAGDVAISTDADPYAGLTCPIKLEAGAEDETVLTGFLDGLVTNCTTDETTATDAEKSKTFCSYCVRPLQTFLAREFHLADLMRTDTEEWDSSNTLIHEKCASDVTDYMSAEPNLMPYDDNFHSAVFACADFAEDPVCTVATEDLINNPDIAAALEQCQLHPNEPIMAMGADEAVSNDTATMAAEHPFCTGCYWPFFEAIVKQTTSQEFRCKMKTEMDTLTDEEIEKALLEDPHLFACLLNVEGYLREKDMKSASIGFSEMEAICFMDMNRPSDVGDGPAIKSWMVHDDMATIMNETVC